MYGNRALSYRVSTKKIPISRSPRWNEWIKFPMIKISQLPLESRVCFDVIIYSATGMESQVNKNNAASFVQLFINVWSIFTFCFFLNCFDFWIRLLHLLLSRSLIKTVDLRRDLVLWIYGLFMPRKIDLVAWDNTMDLLIRARNQPNKGISWNGSNSKLTNMRVSS